MTNLLDANNVNTNNNDDIEVNDMKTDNHILTQAVANKVNTIFNVEKFEDAVYYESSLEDNDNIAVVDEDGRVIHLVASLDEDSTDWDNGVYSYKVLSAMKA